MSPRCALGFLLLFSFCVFPCLGQGMGPLTDMGRWSINGSVRDASDNQALNGIKVDLEYRGVPIRSYYTQRNGTFEFNSVRNGDYTIAVNQDGYEPASVDLTVSGADVYAVSIDLKKANADSSPGASGATISAHELHAPPKARDAYEKGLDLVRSKAAYKDAIAQFQEAIKDFPDYYEAYAMEGAAYMALKDAPSAEAALRKSVQLSASHYFDALSLLAGLLNGTARYAEAQTTAQQTIALDASSWQGHFELARSLLALGHPADAETSALRARELKPDNPKVYLLLAKIHYTQRNSTALLQDCNDYLKVDSTSPVADQVRKNRDQLLAANPQLQTQAEAQPSSLPPTQTPVQTQPQAQPDESRPHLAPPQN